MMPSRSSLLLLLVLATATAQAETPGVPVYREARAVSTNAAILQKATALKEAGALLAKDTVLTQAKRTTCELVLPSPLTQKLEGRELWQRSRKAHLRVGWFYLCKKCEHWHLNLAGGYAITKDSAVTCAHVLEPAEMREGYLIAADDDDNVYGVTEVLASNRALDTSILRLKTDQLVPLPLSTDATPGDTVVCFSDPMDRRGFFSQGIINRFVRRAFLLRREMTEEEKKASAALPEPVWLEASTDWAPGSSGSAVLDVRGNAVGHVSEIEPVLENAQANAKRAVPKPRGTVIVFHAAIAASNVLSMIKKPAP